jgi:UDP-N-acetylmuramoyl-tripeptide--D-alanyl-D-alanine ligase
MHLDDLYQLFIKANQLVSTDTRQIKPASLFFALKGPNFNGNLFVEEALEKGAMYSISDEYKGNNPSVILVDDVLKTLQDLANYHRKQLGIKVIGIGGSNGKTTTKELLHACMSKAFNVFSTVGNLNNHIGVPLTLLQLTSKHQFAIVELGANKGGDIEELCLIAEPDFGLITNIGKEHLEGFGDIEGVAKAESELYDYLLKNNGHSFVNEDDMWLMNMSKRLKNKTGYSIHSNQFSDVQLVPQISFHYKGLHFESPLFGAHNLQNIKAAITISDFFEVNTELIREAIAEYHPQNNRSQIIQTDKGNTILMDAYNANPSSVESAIKTFREMKNKPQYVVLGDMFELGSHEAAEHQAILDLCASIPELNAILVGNAFHRCNITNSNIKTYPNKEEAMQYFAEMDIRNSNVLLKGSRSMKMEDFKTVF